MIERLDKQGEWGRIIPVSPEQITCKAEQERVVGRKILEWSPYCGTYGQGGAGFFGSKLEQTEEFPEEWLILTLWGSDYWLELNSKPLAYPFYEKITDQNRPFFYKPYAGDKTSGWDEATGLLQNKVVDSFDVEMKTASIKIDGSYLVLHADWRKRPLYATGEPRELLATENLQDAWVISPIPNILILE